ncbi:MAG TPA: autotransporter assembly complex family protein [Candidatus Krumholzibacteria bacterium]|nr:autotransporter assembly complex family protein [Candidatus Krumholzibacteria bacterium]
MRALRGSSALALAALLGAASAHAARVDCRLEGIDEKELAENVEATLSIARTQDRKDITAGEIERMHRRATAEIQQALAPFGYYRVTVEDTLIARGKDRFTARYVITLGEPVRVRTVNVSVTGAGRDRPPFPKLVAEYPLKPGDVLDQRAYERRKNTFAAAAADSGYLDATFKTNVIRIDRDENTADIELSFDTGPRFSFGPVIFDSSGVDERVLRSYLTFERGEPFRYDRLLAFQSALGGAPYFGRVETVPRRDLAAGNEVPIEVNLEPRRPRRYEIGVGYGTDTGPRILFGAEMRRLNRAGHRFNGRINVSEVELSAHAEYFIPSIYPDTHAWAIGATVARLDPVAYTTDRGAVGPTRSQKRFGWLESITVSYELEDFSVGEDDGTSDLTIAGLAYRWKRSDDDIHPTRGLRVDLGVRGAHEALLSSQSFGSATASIKGVRSLGGRLRFIGRVDGGYTNTSRFRDLPPTIRFFAGGDNSVRGYEYQSLGPRGADGRVIGGELFLVNSAELELALVGKFAFAAFWDAGNAFEDVGSGVYEQGVGGGLRWHSPVGPIRIDLAFPVDHDDWRIHFTMGPDL